MNKKNLLASGMGVVALVTSCVAGAAQLNYPTKPVRFIAANAAGSILMPDGSRPVTAMAAGGMISDRPILWAEDGPEAYIPLSPSRRGPRTTGILAAANEALGNPLDAGKGGTNITVNTSQSDPYALAAEIARYQAFESVL